MRISESGEEMAREVARRSSTRRAVRSLVGKLVMAYHTININFFFSVATPSTLHVLTCMYRYSEPQAYVHICCCALRNTSHVTKCQFCQWCSTSHGTFISWSSMCCGIPSLVVLHVAWHSTQSSLIALHMALHFMRSRRM